MVKDVDELKNINGGAIKLGVVIGIGSLISFLVGVIDGFLRPLTCNK